MLETIYPLRQTPKTFSSSLTDLSCVENHSVLRLATKLSIFRIHRLPYRVDTVFCHRVSLSDSIDHKGQMPHRHQESECLVRNVRIITISEADFARMSSVYSLSSMNFIFFSGACSVVLALLKEGQIGYSMGCSVPSLTIRTLEG